MKTFNRGGADKKWNGPITENKQGKAVQLILVILDSK